MVDEPCPHSPNLIAITSSTSISAAASSRRMRAATSRSGRGGRLSTCSSRPPAGRRRPLRRRPRGVLRHRDGSRRNAEAVRATSSSTSSWGAVPHPDGRRAARAAAPAADAGVLLAPHGADRSRASPGSSKPCSTTSSGGPDSSDDAIRRQARGRRAGDHHDGPGRAAQEILARLPGHAALATSIRPGEPFPPECRRAIERAAGHDVIAERRPACAPISSPISSRRATRATS